MSLAVVSQGGDGSVVVRRVDAGDRQPALAMLLTGRTRVSPETIEGFLGLFDQPGMAQDQLWAAYRRERLLSSALLVAGAGRTAMCFVSPIFEGALVPVVGQLVGAVCSHQDPNRVRVIQALLDPGQRFESQALSGAGFTEVACLHYMQQSVLSPAASGSFDSSVELLTWNEQRRSLFSQAIGASYENTLDCPKLLGLRQMDDIIDGHMATGCFSPDLWFVLVDRTRPVAVMLLNMVPKQNAVELVYLGVCPSWRKRGVGKQLVRHGLACGYARGVSTMILAVDQANAPAKQLYRNLGFVVHARKSAMIFALP